MLRGQPFGIGVVQMDAMAALLEKEDVPVGAVVPLLEALEFYTVGSALNEVSRASSSYDGEGIPHLSRAARLRALTPDEIFDIVCEQLIDVIIRTVLEKEAVAEQEKAASVPAPRLRSRKAGRNSADAKA
jgi:hypothetical protein